MINLEYKMYIINRQLNKLVLKNKAVRNTHLTCHELTVLEYIYNSSKDTISQKDIMNEFLISRSTVSELISSMEKKGFIERVSSKSDSRIKDIKLTELGLKEYKILLDAFDEANEEAFNCLNEKEQNKLHQLLDKLIESNNIKNWG